MVSTIMKVLHRIALPLASRKVRVALATVVAAYLAECGVGASEKVIFTILGVGVALVLGIAHEDAGKKLGESITGVPPAGDKP